MNFVFLHPNLSEKELEQKGAAKQFRTLPRGRHRLQGPLGFHKVSFRCLALLCFVILTTFHHLRKTLRHPMIIVP